MNTGLQGKKVLVVGLARSGLAAANLLLARGARVRLTDLRDADALKDRLERLEGPAQLTLGQHRREDFLDADLIVVSPGVPSDQPCLQEARRQGKPIWAEVELAFRCMNGFFVGVTGSNGKTTTTTLIGELFRQAGRPVRVAGNIGRPLTELAGEAAQPGTSYVVELSSFQLEHIHRFRCRVAILLNLTPDHLDRHYDFASYARAKERIFNRQGPEDFAILNRDDPALLEMIARRSSTVFPFSRRQRLEEGVFLEEGWIIARREGRKIPILPASEVRLRGVHNLENVLAATASGLVSGLEAPGMAGCFRSFSGVEHRLEYVDTLRGVQFFNDSKATNVDSACKALEAFHEPLLVIMGGRDKGGDFSSLRPLVEARARTIFLIGEAAVKLEKALGGAARLEQADTLPEAVREAFLQAGAGEVVLLAPACASFDMFDDFEHRGRVFKQAVADLRREWEEAQP